MLDIEKLKIIINLMGNLFDEVKKLLFTCDWLREKTELLFYVQVNEKTDCEKRFLFHRNGTEYLCKEYSEEHEEDSTCSIKDRFPYQLDGIMTENKCVVRIRFACKSPCLDENKGRLLLKNNLKFYAQEMQELTTDLFKMDCEAIRDQQKEDLRRFQALTLPWILREAMLSTCSSLEALYEPVRIDCINSLSGEYYEKSECNSNLVFLPKVEKIKASMLMYDFRRKGSVESEIDFSFANIRWIRKLLQMAQKDLYLVFQVCTDELKYEALGLCREDQIPQLLNREENGEVPYFIAKIKKHAQWDLYLGSAYIFSYKNGNYTIEAETPDDYLREKCRYVFGEKVNSALVIRSIRYASRQSHGTMLVVLGRDAASSEMKRLSNFRAGLKNPNLDLDTDNASLEVIENLSAIDGSIIVDTDGRIHGIGVILDGSNEIELNLARGARFNSAKRYQEYLEHRNMHGLILIVSEDGSVEMLTS